MIPSEIQQHNGFINSPHIENILADQTNEMQTKGRYKHVALGETGRTGLTYRIDEYVMPPYNDTSRMGYTISYFANDNDGNTWIKQEGTGIEGKTSDWTLVVEDF